MNSLDLKNIIGIKVDVDTHIGMQRGVPSLISIFNKYHISVSFFIPMGRDDTGRTVKRVWTRRGFLKKASRVGVLQTYGIRTLLYGILLRGPEIAKKGKDIIKTLIEKGHEVGIHGYNHVDWHDHIKDLDRENTEAILKESIKVYRELTGQAPLSFAAPGWMINAHALNFFQENGFIYSSDTRGEIPFLPVLDNRRFNIIQIPSTLPTLDEVVGIEGNDPDTLSDFFIGSLKDGLNILTIHAELEGNRWGDFLEIFIQKALSKGFIFKRLIDIAKDLKAKKDLPICEIYCGSIKGRAGEVSCHTPPIKS
ncbi:MAG TPA: polysaccharide deacetylase family protein [Syntrophorhabdaceae bacterium]|nr:polysaccharide deacetylase family protein [Syntrophorhabdaceae bacterium]